MGRDVDDIKRGVCPYISRVPDSASTGQLTTYQYYAKRSPPKPRENTEWQTETYNRSLTGWQWPYTTTFIGSSARMNALIR